jgi:hypothetical protein
MLFQFNFSTNTLRYRRWKKFACFKNFPDIPKKGRYFGSEEGVMYMLCSIAVRIPAFVSWSRTWWPDSAATVHETMACTSNLSIHQSFIKSAPIKKTKAKRQLQVREGRSQDSRGRGGGEVQLLA